MRSQVCLLEQSLRVSAILLGPDRPALHVNLPYMPTGYIECKQPIIFPKIYIIYNTLNSFPTREKGYGLMGRRAVLPGFSYMVLINITRHNSAIFLPCFFPLAPLWKFFCRRPCMAPPKFWLR